MTSAGGLLPVGRRRRRCPPRCSCRARRAACGRPRRPPWPTASRDAITFDMGGTSTDVCLVLDGAPAPAGAAVGRRLPGAVPVPRHPHHRRRRRLDRRPRPRGRPGRRAAQRRGATRARPATGAAATSPTVTDADLVAGPHPRRRDASAGLAPRPSTRRERALERAGRARRGRDPRGRRRHGAGPARGVGRAGGRPAGPGARRLRRRRPAARLRARRGARHGRGDRAGPRRACCRRSGCSPRPCSATSCRSWPTPQRPRRRSADALVAGSRRGRPRSSAPGPSTTTARRLPLRGAEPRAHRADRRRLPRGPPAAQRLRPPDAPVEVVALRATASIAERARPGRPARARPRRRHRTGGRRRARLHDLDPRGLVGRAGRRRRRSCCGGSGREPRSGRAPGADLPPRRDRRRDGRGAAAVGVEPEHQGAGRLLGGGVHGRRRAARAGRAHPRAPRVDAGVGAGGHRRLRRRARARRPRRGQRPLRRRHPPQRHHRRHARLRRRRVWSAGRPTGPTTPTWAAPRRARSPPTPPTSSRRACASRRPATAASCAACCWRPRARPTSGPATSTRSSGPTSSVRRASPPWPARRSTRSSPTASAACAPCSPACPTAAGASRTSSTRPAPRPEQQHPARIVVTVTLAGDEITFDFTGTDPQSRGNVNAVEAVTVVGGRLRAAHRGRPDHPGQRRLDAPGPRRRARRARSSPPSRPPPSAPATSR